MFALNLGYDQAARRKKLSRSPPRARTSRAEGHRQRTFESDNLVLRAFCAVVHDVARRAIAHYDTLFLMYKCYHLVRVTERMRYRGLESYEQILLV